MSNKVSLPKLVESCEIVEDELAFQVHRLESMVEPRTDSEKEYFGNLLRGYGDAKYWVGILKRYHRGRMEREGEPGGEPAPVAGPFIDED